MTTVVPWAATLRGVSVVEIGHMVAGPVATQVLGDLGADVIKIEPQSGDITRRLGPVVRPGTSAMYSAVNGNKRSIQLDLRAEEVRSVVEALVASADILVTNLDAEMLRRWGYDYETVARTHPSIVYVDVSAFGAGAPTGTDSLVQADRGLMDLTGEPGRPGYRAGASVIDTATGLWAAFAAVSGLQQRTHNGGRGQRYSVSLADVALWLQQHHLAMHPVDPTVVTRNGNHSTVSCTPVLAASDGRVCTVVLHDRHWGDLLLALDRTDLSDDPRFKDEESRQRQQAALEEELATTTRHEPRDVWVRRLRAHRLPCAPERSYAEVLADAALREDGVIYEQSTEVGHHPLQVRPPVRPAGEALPPRRPAPDLGAHTGDVIHDGQPIVAPSPNDHQ